MLEAIEGIVDEQKTQIDIKKHGDGMMMLVIVLVGSINYGRIGIRKTSKEKYLESKKKAKRAVYQINVKQKGK